MLNSLTVRNCYKIKIRLMLKNSTLTIDFARESLELGLEESF